MSLTYYIDEGDSFVIRGACLPRRYLCLTKVFKRARWSDDIAAAYVFRADGGDHRHLKYLRRFGPCARVVKITREEVRTEIERPADDDRRCP